MRQLLWSLTVLMATNLSAQAEEPLIYVSHQGHQYVATANDHGMVLSSLYPAAWFIENGADSRVETHIDVHYLGNDCDAQHDLWGTGTWWWANGGFGVDYENGRNLRFARQELFLEAGLHCVNSKFN